MKQILLILIIIFIFPLNCFCGIKSGLVGAGLGYAIAKSSNSNQPINSQIEFIKLPNGVRINKYNIVSYSEVISTGKNLARTPIEWLGLKTIIIKFTNKKTEQYLYSKEMIDCLDKAFNIK